MQPLKETKVYIPIDINVEFPKHNGNYFVLRNSKVSPKEVDFLSGELGFKFDEKITHWLKEQTGYFLTKQKMEELLNDMSDWAKYFDEKIGIKYSDTELAYQKLKAEYINKLLNNE